VQFKKKNRNLYYLTIDAQVTDEMADSYAFVGLGAMGYGMASNIRQKIPSSSVFYIYDVYQPACDRFISEFGKFGPIVVAKSVKEAAGNAKVLISSLPSTEAVLQVLLDETNGLIAAPVDPERLILETSTNASSVARDLSAKIAEAQRGTLVDTPVSGGQSASLAGKLSFMIGHAEPNPSDPLGLRLEKVLTMMGDSKKLFWCGKTGAGLAAKISNNYIACTIYLVIAEAMAIGVRSGIDPKLLRDVIHNSSGQSFMGDIISTVPSAHLKGGFPVNLMLKDVGLGVAVGKETGVEPTMALAALDIWKKSVEDPSIVNTDGFVNNE